MSAAIDGKSDALFWREFGVVLVLLFLFFIAMIILARIVGGAALERIANAEPDVLARIAPVAEVRVGDPKAATEAEPVQVAGAGGASIASQSGEQIYNTACTACHATGAAGAPKTGDKAAWEPRAGAGVDALVQTVIKGKGAMPPNAGNPGLDEAAIKRAVAYLLEQVDMAPEGVSSAAPEGGAEAAQPSAESESAQNTPQSTKAAQSTETAQSEQVAAAPAADDGVGEAVYNKACLACHSTGAANAPKVGDKAAWEPRLAQGMAGLLNSSISGKGAMPPKGGIQSLTEAEISAAIQFMLNKTGVSAGG